ncbi:hypothetical protein N8550_03080 [Pirellulaceae bacterium]|nr:hypothetical protein [Pirellulaceae bacterium]
MVAGSVFFLSLVLFIIGTRLVRKRTSVNSISDFGSPQADSSLDESFRFVKVTSRGEISVYASTAADAKLAVKELRLFKKSFTLEKRQVAARKKSIRAQYTHDTRQRGSKFRGGGAFGRFVRAVQTTVGDSARSQLASALQPLEMESQRIADAITQIDFLIAQVEVQALRLPEK